MSILAKVRSSRALQAVSRFYSASGLTSIPRMVLVTVAVVAILWVCGQPDWTMGLPINTLAGAVAGAALAKIIVEAVRRLRDAGIDLRLAAWCALAVGIGVLAALYPIVLDSATGAQRSPLWINILRVAVRYGVPILAAAALLWPKRLGPRRTDLAVDPAASSKPSRRGQWFALACVIGGASWTYFITSLSIGMDESNQDAMRYNAEHGYEGP